MDLDALADETLSRRSATIETIAAAFASSPAILLTYRGSPSDLAIRSGDPSEPGRIRVTYLAPDGPRCHVTRDDLAACIEHVADYCPDAARPATEAEVLAWTSTEEYAAGAERIAEVQRWNERHASRSAP
jgi:hypothetical protein